MKDLLKFKKSYERKSGLNNPLVDRIITKVGFEKALIPPYSRQVKMDDLYYNNERVRKFIDNLYDLAMNLIRKEDIKSEIKDLQALKKDLLNANTVISTTKDKFFKNERLALNATDSAEIKTLDVFLKADREQLRKQKAAEKELLYLIELQYKKENGYLV